MPRQHPMRAPEDYMAAAERALPERSSVPRPSGSAAQAYATLSVTATLLQVRDQLSVLVELVAADPAISHVVATRQIITEMREAMAVAGLVDDPAH
jgi:hypothetical protein